MHGPESGQRWGLGRNEEPRVREEEGERGKWADARPQQERESRSSEGLEGGIILLVFRRVSLWGVDWGGGNETNSTRPRRGCTIIQGALLREDGFSRDLQYPRPIPTRGPCPTTPRG